ncbi:nuclease-related domain-containing protein [Pseudoalteromonas sp. T1lg75]|uniref:nuclease-related domain-containing protein n=1 Tax=Pseudoalteromonas sp. T1lg75 TaxID=2077102 RepID=UPI000CF6E7DB|nr:nuclease-related domain-containing protein [Pseudoalteromonas sp. T1lg75]
MSNLLLSITPALLMASGIFLVIGMLYFTLRRHQRRKKLPLDGGKLIRMPAQRINEELIDVGADILSLAGILTATILLPFVIVGIQQIELSSPLFIGAMFGSVIGVFYGLAKVRRAVKKQIKLRLGRDAELASASELMKLQANGYQVFHDVQADGFNIDHLAVGPQGIFAVETKGRHKRVADEENGKKAYVMFYKDGLLQFPSWQEREPLEQAQRQAKWVNDWLIKATGVAHLQTTPVLAFPGWWVEAKTKPPFPIVNHKQLHKTILSMRICPLSDAEISQISYQIVQRCTQGD